MNTITISDSKEENLEFLDYWEETVLIIKSSSLGKTTIDISALPASFFVRTENGDVIKVMRY